jgi:hypothetical protein
MKFDGGEREGGGGDVDLELRVASVIGADGAWTLLGKAPLPVD